jgi:hypothetical protein
VLASPAPQLHYVHTSLYFVTDRVVKGDGFANDLSIDGAFHAGTVTGHASRCRSDGVCKAQGYCTNGAFTLIH